MLKPIEVTAVGKSLVDTERLLCTSYHTLERPFMCQYCGKSDREKSCKGEGIEVQSLFSSFRKKTGFNMHQAAHGREEFSENLLREAAPTQKDTALSKL